MADFNHLVILDSSLFLFIKLVPHIILIIFILFLFLHILLSFLIIVFFLITAALRLPLESAFVIIVLALGTFLLGFPLVLLLFQLIEAGHGRVLLINSLASLVHLLHKVELLRVEGRFETIIDCHFLQLLWHGHESWVRVDF